jgi:hypothetical protein
MSVHYLTAMAEYFHGDHLHPSSWERTSLRCNAARSRPDIYLSPLPVADARTRCCMKKAAGILWSDVPLSRVEHTHEYANVSVSIDQRKYCVGSLLFMAAMSIFSAGIYHVYIEF